MREREAAPRLPADCWQAIFGNAHPVAIEIGPGRGEFLCTAARERPQWNFLAIEHSASRAREIEARLTSEGLDNARVVCADANCLLPSVPLGSAAAVFIQFPDPWWKRRHQKRRLWTPAFVAAVRLALAPGAPLEFLTDVEQTYQLGLECLDGDAGLERVATGHLDRHDTSFARKAIQRGGVIYRALYRRRPD